MNNEFKKSKSNNETRYVLENSATVTTGAVATAPSSLGKVQKRGNILAQEADKDKIDASKPRNFVAKNAKTGGAGAHKDKKKEQKQGAEKHKKPYMEALKQKIDDLKSKLNEAQGVAEVAGAQKCWPRHRKVGTQAGTGKNAGKRVNDCEKIGEDDIEESGLQYHTGVKKHGEEYMVKAAAAGRDGASQKELGALKDKYSKAYKKDGVAEAGNKPLEKSRIGTGDTRTPRDIKSQMKGASDEFVRSTADSKTGPFHSKVAKMQGKMAKSELRRREQGVAEGDRPFRGVGGAFNRGDDERHDLDPTDWYFVKDGKMFAVSIYPNQEREAISRGYSRTRDEAKAKASEQGVAEGPLGEFAPGNSGGESGRWYNDSDIAAIVGDGWYEDMDVSGNVPKNYMIQQAQNWLDDQGYNVQVLNCKLNDDDMDWFIEGTFDQQGVAEGASDYVGDAIEALRVSKPGLGQEDFLDELYMYIENQYGQRAAEMMSNAGQDEFADWYDSYTDIAESAPKGWEGTVKAMKKHKDIDNPYALANYMKNKGYKSHKKEDAYMESLAHKLDQVKKK